MVGAGPAGLSVAARCAGAGLDTLVVEEHPRIGEPTHCTGIISLETQEFAKLPDDIVLNRLTHARLIGPGGEACDVAWNPEPRDAIVAIDRAMFDRQLAAAAAGAGATIRTSARVERVAYEDDGVTALLHDGPVRARACVLACGVSYRFQRALGVGLPGLLIHTAQVEVDAIEGDAVELHVGRELAPGGFAWVVPVRRGARHRLKIGVMARGDAAACLQRFLDRPDVRGRLTGDPGRPVRRLLPLEPLGKTYADRLLIVGDAGGFTKPTTGGGIFYSLLTASLAAETLIAGFQRGQLDEPFLSRYEASWQARLGAELRVAASFRRCLAKATDAELGTLIRTFRSPDLQRIVGRASRFNWHLGVVLTLARHPGIAALLFRAVLR